MSPSFCLRDSADSALHLRHPKPEQYNPKSPMWASDCLKLSFSHWWASAHLLRKSSPKPMIHPPWVVDFWTPGLLWGKAALWRWAVALQKATTLYQNNPAVQKRVWIILFRLTGFSRVFSAGGRYLPPVSAKFFLIIRAGWTSVNY